MYQPSPQIASEEAELVSVRLGQGQPINEGTDDPGNLKLFQEFVLSDNGAAIGEDTEGRECGWRIARDNRVALNFAQALGAVGDDGDGNVYLPDNFADMLRSNAFSGQQVVAEVAHRRYYTKAQRQQADFADGVTEKEGLQVEITRFQSLGS